MTTHDGHDAVMTSATEERYCRENVEFTVKGPIPLFLEEEKKHLSGCAVIDIILSKPERVGELVFRNYYVASIDLLVQVEKEGQQPQQPGRVRQPVNWQVSLQKKVSPIFPKFCPVDNTQNFRIDTSLGNYSDT